MVVLEDCELEVVVLVVVLEDRELDLVEMVVVLEDRDLDVVPVPQMGLYEGTSHSTSLSVLLHSSSAIRSRPFLFDVS